MNRFLFLVLIFLVSPVVLVSAQVTPSDALKSLSENVDITTSPANPGPNTPVTIKIASYSFDINSAQITWTVNGKVVKDGIGETTITTNTGASNAPTNITINIKPLNGSSFSKTITLKPVSVDILLEGYSYTPPFYKGLSLYTNQNTVLLVAMPNITNSSGNLLNAGNLIYTWSQDNTVLGDQSGYGKNSLSLTDSVLSQPTTISVVATDLNKTFIAQNSIYLAPSSPFVLFYENNPLYGLRFENALLNNFSMTDKEINIVGIPFYFAIAEKLNNSLKYTWTINGSTTSAPNYNSIILRQGGTTTGTASLGLQINNPVRVFQSDTKSININYSSNTSL